MAQAKNQQTKAAALAELSTGASINATARKFGVDRSTVKRWRDASGMVAPTVPPQKKADLGEQLYDYLAESIETLVAQLRFARDPTWLAKQNAADLAVFMGVTSDKATRLLAALRPSASADQPAVIDIPGAATDAD